MADNKFGLLYPFVRLTIAILIILMIILQLKMVIDYYDMFTASHFLWIIFSFISLLIGIIGVWKEHFLFTLLFLIIGIILVMIGRFTATWIDYSYNDGLVMATLILSAVYLYMLHENGHREMNMPRF
ncbi:hypothetical protein DERF_014633 [Dermatophagoides farinae]|uniref:Uncharacterized protein n=1 Tax=Dermatophagoides farinae TaxID=6954 RepID=A0A922HMJ7_DERFA|nr:hypothetical protein HUG17_6576 [Dermatophagoides farinae]KAH9493907.1 hypothetical protein DERF_014633 [Dermatophagoides farinae]